MLVRLLSLFALFGACAGFSPLAARSARICVGTVVLDSPRIAQRTSSVLMAVPKKRQSKTRTATRKAVWLGKPRKAAILALSRAAAAGYDPLADEAPEAPEAPAAPAAGSAPGPEPSA